MSGRCWGVAVVVDGEVQGVTGHHRFRAMAKRRRDRCAAMAPDGRFTVVRRSSAVSADWGPALPDDSVRRTAHVVSGPATASFDRQNLTERSSSL